MNMRLFSYNTKYLLIMFIGTTLISGCSTPPKRPTYLVPTYGVSKDYKALGSRATFEKDNLVISLKTLSPDDGVKGETLSALKENHYIFMELTFMNKSEKRVTYNTSFTSLQGAQFDYRKPLNFTDLYSIVVGKAHDLSKEKDLKKLKDKYYDHMTRIPPKESVTKYLIFRPNEKETTKAVLIMGEIYMGTKTLSVVFPFDALEIETSGIDTKEGTGKTGPKEIP